MRLAAPDALRYRTRFELNMNILISLPMTRRKSICACSLALSHCGSFDPDTKRQI